MELTDPNINITMFSMFKDTKNKIVNLGRKSEIIKEREL